MLHATNTRLAWLLPWVVLCLGLGLTYTLQDTVRHSARQTRHNRFNSSAGEIINNVQTHLNNYEQVLNGAGGLFAASKSVERNEFRDYVSSLHLQERYPGIQGVGFARVVSPDEKPRFISQIRQEGFPRFRLFPEGGAAYTPPSSIWSPSTGATSVHSATTCIQSRCVVPRWPGHATRDGLQCPTWCACYRKPTKTRRPDF